MKLILRAQKIIYRAIILLLVIGSLVMGCLYKGAASDCGLNGVETLDDVYNLPVVLDYAWDTSNVGMIGTDYGVENATVIALIKPTGRIKQYEDAISQEFVVTEVLRGEEGFSAGETGYIFEYFGFSYISGQIKYMNTLNLMQAGKEYLAFLEPSPLNSYQSMSAYTLTSSVFGYIKVSEPETITLPTDYQSLSFTGLSDCAFFSTCPEITEYLNRSYKDILQIYLPPGERSS